MSFLPAKKHVSQTELKQYVSAMYWELGEAERHLQAAQMQCSSLEAHRLECYVSSALGDVKLAKAKLEEEGCK